MTTAKTVAVELNIDDWYFGEFPAPQAPLHNFSPIIEAIAQALKETLEPIWLAGNQNGVSVVVEQLTDELQNDDAALSFGGANLFLSFWAGMVTAAYDLPDVVSDCVTALIDCHNHGDAETRNEAQSEAQRLLARMEAETLRLRQAFA